MECTVLRFRTRLEFLAFERYVYIICSTHTHLSGDLEPRVFLVSNSSQYLRIKIVDDYSFN